MSGWLHRAAPRGIMRLVRGAAALGLAVALAGCVSAVQPATPLPPVPAGSPLTPEQAARNFVTVVNRVEPVAERICRQRAVVTNCDFQIAIDDQPGAAPNAFQTVDDAGRPYLVFTLALIADARNQDELAFVLGHEASHHIAGHMDRQDQSAMTAAILAGVIASAGGANAEAVRAAQDFGAEIGARTYSKDFELEADALGAEIAWRAGYDPRVGMAFFDRLPDPGDEFLGTHPPNSRRKDVVARVTAALEAEGG